MNYLFEKELEECNFDPKEHLQPKKVNGMPMLDESGEIVTYLPWNWELSMFLRIHPEGCAKSRIIAMNDQYVVFETRLYRKPEDENPISNGFGRGVFSDFKTEFDPFDTAEILSLKRALEKAGFGTEYRAISTDESPAPPAEPSETELTDEHSVIKTPLLTVTDADAEIAAFMEAETESAPETTAVQETAEITKITVSPTPAEDVQELPPESVDDETTETVLSEAMFDDFPETVGNEVDAIFEHASSIVSESCEDEPQQSEPPADTDPEPLLLASETPNLRLTRYYGKPLASLRPEFLKKLLTAPDWRCGVTEATLQAAEAILQKQEN